MDKSAQQGHLRMPGFLLYRGAGHVSSPGLYPENGSGKGMVHFAPHMATPHAVAKKCQELSGYKLAPLDFLNALVVFMATHPNYETAGIDVVSLSAWGVFKDGAVRVHAVTSTRNRGVDAMMIPSLALSMDYDVDFTLFGEKHTKDTFTFSWTAHRPSERRL